MFAQGHEFLVSLLISHQTSGVIHYHADSLGQSVTVVGDTHITHTQTDTGLGCCLNTWTFSRIYARPHTQPTCRRKKQLSAEPIRIFVIPFVTSCTHAKPANISTISHICLDKLKVIETTWRGVRYLYFVNHQNVCKEALLSDGWCVGSYYCWKMILRLSILAERVSQHFTCYVLCKKVHIANWINSRFSNYFLVQCFFKHFPWWERSLGLLVAYSCLVAVCTGSWGPINKGVQKADGDVTVREGPHRQQQNRCTEQQTASSYCEKFPLILVSDMQTCTVHTHSWKSRQPCVFKTEAKSLISHLYWI